MNLALAVILTASLESPQLRVSRGCWAAGRPPSPTSPGSPTPAGSSPSRCGFTHPPGRSAAKPSATTSSAATGSPPAPRCCCRHGCCTTTRASTHDPEAFRPDRWADGLAKRLPRFAYFPFGGGPRLCIGSGFATTEATLLLATIARRFRMTLEPGHPVLPWPTITLRPRHGMRMVLHPRR
jgi:hypothetical protein